MTSRTEVRCDWARTELSIPYHDAEWGLPQHDDRVLFEFLVLEGVQAGLSWETILRKRDRYRQVYDGFDPERVAHYAPKKQAALLADPGIVRNRLKVAAAVTNAKAYLSVQKEFGTFDSYVWSFVGGTPLVNHWKTLKQIPASTPESDALSKDLRKRGFTFVGSTIIYAFMQAVGMVNDHVTSCFRWPQVSRLEAPTEDSPRCRPSAP